MSKNAAIRVNVQYPFLPKGRTIHYVSADNPFMKAAQEFCAEHSLDKAVPTGSVVVKDGIITGRGANGSMYHQTHVCERVKRNIPTGQGYELCEGCHPKNHSEPKAINEALENNAAEGADLYLWGHWWCCEPCWTRIIEGGIKNVYLLEGSYILFDRANPNNILGQQNV